MPFRIKHGYVGRQRRNVGDRPKTPQQLAAEEKARVELAEEVPEKLVEVAIEIEPEPVPLPEPEEVEEEPEDAEEDEPEEERPARDLNSLTKSQLYKLVKDHVSKKDAQRMRKEDLIELVREHTA